MSLGKGFWTANGKIRVTRRLSPAEWFRYTRPYASSLYLLQGEDGQKLGRGSVPFPCPMTKLQALLLRQCTVSSENDSNMGVFSLVAKFVVEKVVESVRTRLSVDVFRPELVEDDFMASMPGKSREFMRALWLSYIESLRCEGNLRSVKENHQFPKQEDCYKENGETKPRGITVMCSDAYVHLYRLAVVAKLIYETPVIGQWLIKYRTTEQLFENLLSIIEESHRAQDISGFEAAIGPDVRHVLENDLIGHSGVIFKSA